MAILCHKQAGSCWYLVFRGKMLLSVKVLSQQMATNWNLDSYLVVLALFCGTDFHQIIYRFGEKRPFYVALIYPSSCLHG